MGTEEICFLSPFYISKWFLWLAMASRSKTIMYILDGMKNFETHCFPDTDLNFDFVSDPVIAFVVFSFSRTSTNKIPFADSFWGGMFVLKV